MVVKGYKCFNEDFTNKYGMKFELGKIYIADINTKVKKFHLCKNLEDTFRYFDAINNNVRICEVIGSGNIVPYSEEYQGYYDMYSVSQLEIKKELTHDEIISYGLNLDSNKVKRFIVGFKLTEEEMIKFANKFKNEQSVLDIIASYIENNNVVYKKR